MPFIKDDSVRRILDAADIAEIVGDFIDLKKNTACCPFHTESTPSFHVTPAKGIYKCYGCGVGGDSLSFVMKHENIEFIEAVEYIAKKYHIEPEYEAKEVNELEVAESKQMTLILDTAAKSFQDELYKKQINDIIPVELLKNRALSIDTIIDFKIGFAPDGWKFLTSKFIQGNMYAAAVKLGIIVTKSGNTYDQFRNRIMFPIQDHKGRMVAFGGRKLKAITKEEIASDKDNPKYINSAESKFYKKENILYGLFQAAKSIRVMGKAILTEGYYDVVSMHDKGATNTVATCGTAFTKAHATLLKKYTNHVIIFYDSDKAGTKATMSAIDILVKEGFKVQVFANNTGVDALDPDSFARMFTGDLPEWLLYTSEKTVSIIDPFFTKQASEIGTEEKRTPLQIDFDNSLEEGILFKTRSIFYDVEDGDTHDKAGAFSEVCDVLSLIENDFKRTSFIDILAKEFKLKSVQFTTEIKAIKDLAKKREEKLRAVPESDAILPKHVDPNVFMRDGFYTDDTPDYIGFWFVQNQKTERKTNFLLKPIMHIYSKDVNENRRIVELDNGEPNGCIAMEFPNVGFQSLDKFDSTVWNEGFYILYGLDKNQLQKIKNKYANSFPKCWELKNLGWQSEGFWAFNNNIFNINTIQVEKFNKYGIIQHKGTNFYSPSASAININTREKDNEYENDMMHTFVESPIKFNEWATLMNRVYGENGNLGVLYIFVGLFRDIVYKLNNSCPFLYGYGQVQSGKTVWADSISAVFFKGMKAFNLNQGTDYAFFERLGRYYNCVITFNEFDENAVKDAWFRALKAAFDGEGREKGKGGTKNKTTTQKIESAIVLLGQYLSVKDDASVLSRSIPAPFKQSNERGSKEDYNLLKQYEEHGLSGMLTELLVYRKLFEDRFYDAYAEQMKAIKVAIKEKDESYKERIVQNYCVLLTVLHILKDKFNFPFTYETFFNYTVDSIINLSSMIESSNALSGFWKMVEFLLDQGLIEEKWDFKIETVASIKIVVEGGHEKTVPFEQPKKVVYVRLGNIHKLYSEQIRRQTGNVGLNEQTLQMYMHADPAYIGRNNSSRFSSKKTQKSSSTSSFVFDLDKLNINLERFANDIPDDDKESLPVNVVGIVGGDAKLVDVAGLPMTEFTLITHEKYTIEGSALPVEKMVYTKCLSEDVAKADEIKHGMSITATGMLRVRKYTSNGEAKESRKLILINLEITAKPDAAVNDVNAVIPDLPF